MDPQKIIQLERKAKWLLRQKSKNRFFFTVLYNSILACCPFNFRVTVNKKVMPQYPPIPAVFLALSGTYNSLTISGHLPILTGHLPILIM